MWCENGNVCCADASFTASSTSHSHEALRIALKLIFHGKEIPRISFSPRGSKNSKAASRAIAFYACYVSNPPWEWSIQRMEIEIWLISRFTSSRWSFIFLSCFGMQSPGWSCWVVLEMMTVCKGKMNLSSVLVNHLFIILFCHLLTFFSIFVYSV